MDQLIPAFLREALTAQYGGPLAEEIASGFTPRKPVTLRVNTLKADAREVDAALAAAGIEAQPVDWYADARLLPEADEPQVQALSVYTEGKLYLQGLSAMLPPLLMPLAPGTSVLDMCAAPGGKSTQMAALAGGQIDLTLCERDAARAERLRHNVQLQGVRRAVVMNTDAAQLDPAFRFDAILLDAPCTGSGTLRLGEGIPPRRMEKSWVDKTVRTQRKLLQKAWALLKPGGTLVYATCSILRQENEDAVQTLLERGAKLTTAPDALADALPSLPAALPGCLCVRPTPVYEGFFVSVLKKP